MIQRCILHKERAIPSHLPPSCESEAKRCLWAARGLVAHDEVREVLGKVRVWLEPFSPSAAKGLELAFEDTFTVHHLGVTDALRKTLINTSPIESAFDIVRSVSVRAKRRRDAAMVMRWTGSGLARAEEPFRGVKGHEALAGFVSTLEATELPHGRRRHDGFHAPARI